MTDPSVSADGMYFLSYSRSDDRFALRFAKDIRANGVHMWVDQLDIRPSEHWDRAIERAVQSCRGLVVIVSPRSVASENVADEISFAISSGKSVLPVMIEKCVLPLRITRMHVVDATGSYDKALQQCLAELKRSGDEAASKHAPAHQAAEPLDPAVIADAKQRLTPLLGPITGIVVDKAAARSGSPAELYGQLALRIDDESERERFLADSSAGEAPPKTEAGAASPPGKAIAQSDLDSIASALTPYLGPIAPMVIKRESRTSGSLDELRQRLAALIPAEQDRTAFLRKLGAQ